MKTLRAQFPLGTESYGMILDDAVLVRYLRARDLNVEKAAAMLTATLNWRRDFGLPEASVVMVVACDAPGVLFRHTAAGNYPRRLLLISSAVAPPPCETSAPAALSPSQWNSRGGVPMPFVACVWRDQWTLDGEAVHRRRAK